MIQSHNANCDKIEIMPFDAALDDAKKKHDDKPTEEYVDLLLGNGYTLALDPEFNYHLDPNSPPNSLQKQEVNLLKKYKKEYGFDPSREDILRSLHRASWTCEALSDTDNKRNSVLDCAVTELNEAIFEVRREFLKSIVDENEEDLYQRVRQKTSLEFIKKFDHVFTTNYDLALYWDQAISKKFCKNDGFGFNKSQSEDLKWWNKPDAKCHYLHGALHIYVKESGDSDVLKFIAKKDKPVLLSIREWVDLDKEPLFVAGGTELEKVQQIGKSKYLEQQRKEFMKQVDDPNRSLFIFGSSVASADKHLWNLIEKGNITDLYISSTLSRSSEGTDEYRENSLRLRMIKHHFEENRNYSSSCPKPLDVHFFDADSAHVWKDRP